MKTNPDPKTINALKWIVSILDKHNIPYRIGGGFAAHIYGSGRPINDIDISLSGEYFPIIVAETTNYIVEGPEHYVNEKWDCVTLTLNYEGQEIEITDVDTLKMSKSDMKTWILPKDYFRKYPNNNVVIGGIEVSVFDPHDLAAYKRELADDNHKYQLSDAEAVERHIEKSKIMI